MDRETTFTKRIAEPLEAVLGKVLVAADYWILRIEEADLSAAQPNATGIAVVSMQFGTSSADITCGWEGSLRANGIHYHIQAHQSDEAGGTRLVDAETFCEVSASDVAPWREAIGKPLTSVQVMGFKESPQAIRFSFSDAVIVVATGYSGCQPRVSDESHFLIGDGDELLTFSDQDWHNWHDLAKLLEGNWELLWTASAAIDDLLLVK